MGKVLVLLIAVILTGCAPAPAPLASPPPDPTRQPWYTKATAELSLLVRDAETQYDDNHPDRAAALIQKAEPIATRLIAVPKPTLAAAQAASDLDFLYGRMLLANRHYGWARLLFQKNLARWKHWEPQTEETASRLKQANAAIAECDRHL